MPRQHAVVFEENLRIPGDAFTFEGFRRWVESDEFPETGRIDFLAGDVEVEMSPEDLQSHAVVKAAIAKTFQVLVSEQDRGEVYIDRARVHVAQAGLSVEPDVVVALWESFDCERVRYATSAAGDPDHVPALEGAPDLVVEIVSPSSVRKDTVRLPHLYALAGVPEFWLVDARADLRFQVHTLLAGDYVLGEPDPDGSVRSPRLGGRFRLLRHRTRRGTWRYVLEHEP